MSQAGKGEQEEEVEGEREWGGRRERATDFVLHLPMSIFLCCQPLPTKFEPSHIIHPFVLIVVDRRAILGKRVKQDQGGKEVELEIDRSSRRTGRTFRSVCVEGCTLTYFVPRPAGSSLSDGSRVANGGRREGGGGGGRTRDTLVGCVPRGRQSDRFGGVFAEHS